MKESQKRGKEEEEEEEEREREVKNAEIFDENEEKLSEEVIPL